VRSFPGRWARVAAIVVVRVAALVVMLFTVLRPTNAGAQELSRVSLDSVTAIDLFRGDGTTGNPDASVDISSVIRIGGGWSAHLRPWFFRPSSTQATWSKELYQAALRYERPGRTAVRLDAGYIASPIGLGMLDMRADTNPTISPHLAYFMPLLSFDRAAPGVGAIAASYPLGANVTVSTTRWDARAALVNSAPTRRYVLNADGGNPHATPVLIVGGGVTPAMGLRFGASIAAGQYATADETGDAAARDLRMWTIEGEYAFGYTKIAGEVTREHFDHGSTRDSSLTWFVQGTQTLTPRWFAAARHEAIGAPPPVFLGPGATGLSFRTTETTIGYRLTPELTLRSSVTAQRGYLAASTDKRVGVQVVWSRRWW
jgi:hypothetical protein